MTNLVNKLIIFSIISLLLLAISGLALAITQNSNLSVSSKAKTARADQKQLAMQQFYRQPSFNQLVKNVNWLIQGDEQQKKQQTTHFQSGATEVYAVMAVHKHPSYVTEISKKFAKLPQHTQNIFLYSVTANGYADEAKKIQQQYSIHDKVTINYTPQKIQSLEVSDSAFNLDLLWTAYFATGDNAYLKKILNYINRQDHFILIAAYEVVNRNMLSAACPADSKCPYQDMSDIFSAAKRKYPANYQKMINRIMTVSAALWSLSANSEQNSVLAKRIGIIVKENPKLDYWKKINESNDGAS